MTNKIGRIASNGTFGSEIAIPTANSLPEGITLGSDHNIWFTENGADKIGTVR